MQKTVTIGVFDSGVGGLSVLRELEKALPEARFVFFADTAHCPYGEKSAEYVLERSRTITEVLLRQGAEAIVIACNTATSAAIATLRTEYGTAPSARVMECTGGERDCVPFIGMEPAVKPAALSTRTGVVGVLATAGTLSGSKYLDMKGRFSDGVEIVESVGRGFVELVEGSGVADCYKKGCLFLSSESEETDSDDGSYSSLDFAATSGAGRFGSGISIDSPQAEEIVRRSLAPLLDAGADTVVLGCTHYPFLLPTLERVSAQILREHPLRGKDGKRVESIRFIDPAPAVARHLLEVLRERGLIPPENETSSGKLI